MKNQRLSVFLLLLFCMAPLRAMLLEGTWSNSIYIYRNPLDSLQPMLNIYEGLGVNGRYLAGTNLCFSSDFRYTNRFANTGHKTAEVSHLYMGWKSDSGAIDLRAGRQALFEGVRPLYLDGVRAEWRIRRALSLMAAGGLRVPSRYSSKAVLAVDDSSALNVLLRAESHLAENTGFDLLYHQSSGKRSSLQRNAGFDFRQRFSGSAQAFASLQYDITRARPDEFLLSAGFRPFLRAGMQAGLAMRNTQVDSLSYADTLLWGRHFSGYFNGSFDIGKTCALFLGYSGRLFSGNTLQNQLTGRLALGAFFLALRQDFGGLGTGSRADAGLNRRLNKTWAGGLYGSAMRYQFSTLDAAARVAWQASAFTDISLPANIEMSVEYQLLGNRYLKYDNRLYLRTWMQFSRFKGQ